MHLAGLLAQRHLPLRDMLDRYELFMYKQWLRVYMRSKMIKHNKDLFETLDDPLALLDKLYIYQRVSSSFVTVSRPQGDGDRGADYASTLGNTERTGDVEALLRMPAPE
jgi:hypothetical protein